MVVFATYSVVFPSLNAGENKPSLKDTAVLVKRQISPDEKEDNSSSRSKNYYSI